MSRQDTSIKPNSRRNFLKAMPAAPLLPAALADLAVAQTPASDSFSEQAEALAQVARLRFGSYLKDGDLSDIKRVIERNLRYADALAKVKISNSDEPDFMFIPNQGL